MSQALKQWLPQFFEPGDTLLDIGCGNGIFKMPQAEAYTSVDAFPPANPDYLLDLEIEDLPFEHNSFDIVFMLDFIEHLERDRGFEILEQAKRITRKKLFLFTPLWWDNNSENIKQGFYKGNSWNLHKSLYSKEDFPGFEAIVLPPYEKYFLGIWKP